MFVAAALVPDTALVVPGASGARDAAAQLRAAARDAVRDALTDVDRVVVVAPADAVRSTTSARPAGRLPAGTGGGASWLIGVAHTTLAAVGVPDAMLAEVLPTVRLVGPDDAPGGSGVDPHAAVVPGVATSVALHLLAPVWPGPVHALEVTRGAPEPDPAALRALGADVVAGAGRVALVVVGSGSGRHGPDAPLADDPAALDVDAMLTSALAAPTARSLDEVAALDAGTASTLAVSGRPCWQVLVGAVGDVPLRAEVAAPVLLGAQHVVGTWRAHDAADRT